jgi:uncharacterized protein YjiS (DUF1127 family)
MTTRELTSLTAAPGNGGLFYPFVLAVLDRAAQFVQATRNRRQVATLLKWDARMLRDIGLTPGDVRAVMAAPIGDDPSDRLTVISAERRAAFQAQARERLARRRARR